jgi:hypothetical protein
VGKNGDKYVEIDDKESEDSMEDDVLSTSGPMHPYLTGYWQFI